MSPIRIRPETVADYPALAALHARAFDQQLAEALIVSLHRQRSSFDPELSLVAEVDEQIAGHALFNPCNIQLMGQSIKAVNLAPIGVAPDFQRRGIGGALIEEGHRIARGKGFILSFLLGHTEYYPRFGYRPRAYGMASVNVKPASVQIKLDKRPPFEADIEQLMALWRAQESEVDFAIEPEPALTDWLSPNPAIDAVVFEQAGEVVGFMRVHKDESCTARYFLARDAGIARAMVASLAAGCSSLVLPLHPRSSYTQTLDGSADTIAWESGMACPLAPSPYDEYERQVRDDQRPPGRPLWNTAFDLA